ncbi:hypothetical protein ILUMI_24883 [Ignelater luminosus]|uniref:Selenoprotein F n=1 Tax=Ignelater luminosus TaxID=2038154 RepID=A0A8K0CB10_IGNLU|nr:hypothetical protein ILUMI_24883 [Ignelater luminosus]
MLLNFIKSLAFLILLSTIYAERTSEECREIGFNKANLLCSSCDLLNKFNLNILQEQCRSCCHHDENIVTEKKYAKAVLEVCTCKFGAYPQIQAFIKSDRPAKFPNLQIRYVRGLDPIIKLFDKDGNLQETVAIEKWNTDSVEEYLNIHLEKEENDYLRTNMV